MASLKPWKVTIHFPGDPPGQAQQQKSRTGYPAIEQGRRPRWPAPAVQLQRVLPAGQCRAAGRHVSFLCLFSAREESTDCTPQTLPVDTALFNKGEKTLSLTISVRRGTNHLWVQEASTQADSWLWKNSFSFIIALNETYYHRREAI